MWKPPFCSDELPMPADRSAHRKGRAQHPGRRRLAPHPFLSTLLLLAYLAPPLTLHASEFRLGLDAYLDADYDKAIEIWQPLAESGNAAAQYSLGTLYDGGKGVPKDDEKAVKWFQRAAEQGHPAAQFNLGNAYRTGQGASQDQSLAARWWRKAAEQDFAPAQFNLGTLYYFGRGVAEDQESGLQWYRRAAANEYAPARQVLAKHGVAQPPVKRPPVTQNQEWRKDPPQTQQPRKDPPQADRGLMRESWLLAQDAGRYTVQLTAGPEERGLIRYVREHGLSGDLAYFTSRRNGGDWFSLLYGNFANYTEAKQTLAALPGGIRDGGAWIRSLASVHKAIGETGYAHAD